MLFALVLFFAAGASSPQGTPTDPCGRLYHIPLGIDPGLKLKVVNHWLEFGPEAEGGLCLQNETGKAIYGIEVDVNYEDQGGRRIFTMSYQATAPGSEHRMSAVGALSRGTLTRPVRPGEVFDLFGANLLATTAIPASARVWGVDIEEADRGIVHVEGGTGRSDPILYAVPPGFPQLGGSPDYLPRDVLLKLSINSRGTVESVQPSPDAQSADALVASATAQMRRWVFLPAVRAGYAVNSDLFVLVEFRRGDFPPVRDCFIGRGDKYPKTFAIVTFESHSGVPGGWQCLYGGYNVGGWAGALFVQPGYGTIPRKMGVP